MLENRNTILVTWDFTEVSENALLHAIKLSRTVENNIRLVNVVKPGNNILLKETEEKLKKEILRIKDKYKIILDSVILEGSLFSAITNYLKDSDVNMVLM